MFLIINLPSYKNLHNKNCHCSSIPKLDSQTTRRMWRSCPKSFNGSIMHKMKIGYDIRNQNRQGLTFEENELE